ncbi:gliding motility protein GldL [Fulvivirga kasyanovii]|uniref:Gliding motility protein GldL n=2 Tax=Fulvivirga kasyanovii TaxID=396812 RepID=A0ABW9RU18_9BACT|nr:gliding motility protein GldL [Fulvivirga kasyanovii]
MKVKHIIAIFLLGITIMVVGALLKILHLPGANITIGVASVLKTMAGLLAIWKVYTTEKFRDFLNS